MIALEMSLGGLLRNSGRKVGAISRGRFGNWQMATLCWIAVMRHLIWVGDTAFQPDAAPIGYLPTIA